MIDLHGQHVAEAIKLLRRELSRLRRAGGQNRQPAELGTQRVQILVGTNHHSKVRLPLLPTIFASGKLKCQRGPGHS